MHAYAADDPVFVAMNARAQREANVGTFCLDCHAPVAVRLGAITAGQSPDTLDKSLRGVTCYFCHTADGIDAEHNGKLHLAGDGVMRGGVRDPVAAPHLSAYSALHDRDGIASAPLCGSCHDIVTPGGAAAATTFTEWKGTIFAHDVPGVRLSCSSCHMPGTDGAIANVPTAPKRQLHGHDMPGVDVALTDFPHADEQRAAVQANLDPALVVKLCVNPPSAGATVTVSLDNAFVGHGFPSGASYDRRVWVEVVATKNGAPLYQSGVVPDGESPLVNADPDRWIFRTTLTDAAGAETPFQWLAHGAQPSYVPPAVTNDPMSMAYYHAVTHDYAVPLDADDIKVRVWVTPIDPALLKDLVASGDLDPSIVAKMPRFVLAGSVKEWTKPLGFTCVQ